MSDTAKVFRSGNSQAVRLPKKFRFSAGVREVSVHRKGNALVLAPLQHTPWPESFWRAFGRMSADFERPAQVPQKRPDPVQ